MRYVLSLAFTLLFTSLSAYAQATSEPSVSAPDPTALRVKVPPEKSRPIVVPKVSNGPVIDGKLDDEIWKNAAVLKDFIQTNPGNNIAPSKPTEAYIAYDEKHLYVAFKCWDDRDKIRASIAQRDNVFNEDNVRFWIDTYNDQRRAYVLGFNPLGIQQDGIYTEGNGADFSVDIVMESKGVIEDWGWSVEVSIPFKSLRYAAGKGKLWGFNAARNIDRLNDEFDQWMPDDRNVSGFLIKFGKIGGLDSIKYERTLEMTPSVTLSETGSRKSTLPNSAFDALGSYDPIYNPIGIRDPGKFVNDPAKLDLSLNLKYTLSPSMTLDAAINPDFAEIEADSTVVTANQRFPIFFEEKRPFFLEGKDIFDTPLNTFYSRTIVDPDAAVKLTGKKGKTLYGILAASDKAPGNFSDDERGEILTCKRNRLLDPANYPAICVNENILDKNATFGIFRLKRDVGRESSLGFMGTARVFPYNRNFTGGFDGKFKLNPSTLLTFQTVATYSKKRFYDANDDRSRYRAGTGFGYFVNLDHTTDTRGWMIEGHGRTKDYRADNGFTEQTNTNSWLFWHRFSTTSKPQSAIIRANWRQFAKYNFDFNGRSQGGTIGTGLNLSLQRNVSIGMETGLTYEKIYEDEFGAKRDLSLGRSGAFTGENFRSAYQPYISINAQRRFSKRFTAYTFFGSILNAFDYDFGAGNKYPRASRAFTAYLRSAEYLHYISDLYAYQQNPNTYPYPVNFPEPPALDPGKSWQLDFEAGAEFLPIDPLSISVEYSKNRLRRNDTRKLAFDSDIVSLRSVYSFSRFTFVRSRLDYDRLSSNIRGQVLFGWAPNPGTAFYAGYNDDANYNGFSPFTNQSEPGFYCNSRTFFIRASYLFRKSL